MARRRHSTRIRACTRPPKRTLDGDMGGRGWRIGRIWGTEVRADPSVLLIAALIALRDLNAYSTAPPGMRVSGSAALGLAIASAVLFFGSVLVHELAHAAVAKARHVEVVGITLWMFGGATQTRVDSPKPSDE